MSTENPPPQSQVPRKRRPGLLAAFLRDEKSKPRTLLDLSIAISVAAVAGYILSTMYVTSISTYYGYPVTIYLTLIDYIQIIPQYVIHDAWGLILLVIVIYITYVALLQVWLSLRPTPLPLDKLQTGVRKRQAFFLFFLWVALILTVLPLWYRPGRVTQAKLEEKPLFTIYLKGGESLIKGRLVFQASRYLLLVGEHENTMLAIPQTEVVRLEAPWTFPSPSPPVATTATPSQTWPTPNPSVIISTIALLVSIATAWFTLYRRGNIHMTRPVLVGFLHNFPAGEPKIFFRALVFATGKRGHIVESIFLKIRRGETAQTFNFWMIGEARDLTIGSGLRVGEDGVSFNHHFRPSKDDTAFLFLAGEYLIQVYSKIVNRQAQVLLFSTKLSLSEEHAVSLRDPLKSVLFTWRPEAQCYRAHVEEAALF